MRDDETSRLNQQLALSTLAFALCFMAWGLVAAFAKQFQALFALAPGQKALLVAVPVLLGSLARIPLGMLTDRFGARRVFALLMAVSALPVLLVPLAGSYTQLLAIALLLGLSGSSFAVGVGHTSRWAPRERQGAVLGIYGLGNIGQSLAVFGGPLLALNLGLGWQNVFYGVGALLLLGAALYWLLARDAPGAGQAKGLAPMVRVLTQERRCWVLALFYGLTFGGFVAFGVYLPTLLPDAFGLTQTDAGLRTAGFVVLATLLRPVGGQLADRHGGAAMLRLILLALVPAALLLTLPTLLTFTLGALACAALLGLGNGAVFKMVPQYFPQDAGTVTGLVGAIGGLGGFFPPLALGWFQATLGVLWPGFALLAATAAALAVLNEVVFLRRQPAGDSAETAPPVLAAAGASAGAA